MPSKKLIEAKPCDIELSLGLFELALRNQHIGKTPIDLWIAARKRWQEQRFRVAGAALTRADLCQMHTCLHIAGQVRNRTSIPERGKVWIRYRHEFAPQHAELKADPRQWERRNVVVRGKRPLIDIVRLGEATEIGKHGGEQHALRRARRCGTRQVTPRIAEAMPGRSDLGLNKRRAGRPV